MLLRKPPEALLWGINQDGCNPDCFWQPLYDREGTQPQDEADPLPGRWERQKNVGAGRWHGAAGSVSPQGMPFMRVSHLIA